jgi:hypothetical protein
MTNIKLKQKRASKGYNSAFYPWILKKIEYQQKQAVSGYL